MTMKLEYIRTSTIDESNAYSIFSDLKAMIDSVKDGYCSIAEWDMECCFINWQKDCPDFKGKLLGNQE